MGWVKIEDRYSRHPKMMEAGEAGLALDVCGMCYCREQDTAGFIPDHAVTMLGPVKNPRKVAAVLERVGRWVRDDEHGGWWVHDFAAFNPTNDEAALARSEKARKAADARWGKRDVAPSNAQASGSKDAPSIGAEGCSTMPPSLPLPKPLAEGTPPRHPKPLRDAAFQSLVALFGDASTKSRASLYGSVVIELLDAGATPATIAIRGRRLLDKGWTDVSPKALTQHWDALATANTSGGLDWDTQ